jgi:hypothetical protein
MGFVWALPLVIKVFTESNGAERLESLMNFRLLIIFIELLLMSFLTGQSLILLSSRAV